MFLKTHYASTESDVQMGRSFELTNPAAKFAELRCGYTDALGLSHQSVYRTADFHGRRAKMTSCYSVPLTIAAVCIAANLAAAQKELLTVRADSSFDASRWASTIQICSELHEIFTSKVGEKPPIGRLPIVISKVRTPTARLDLSALPKAYKVELTHPDSKYACQIVAEAGHEFAHIWIGPKSGPNWFVESVCTAASGICLEEMANAWRYDPRKGRRDYAPEFRALQAVLRRDSPEKIQYSLGRCSRIVGEEQFNAHY